MLGHPLLAQQASAASGEGLARAIAAAAPGASVRYEFCYSPGTDFLSLNNVLGAYGARFMTPDGKKLAMDTPEFLSALRWVRDIFLSKAAPAPGADATTRP